MFEPDLDASIVFAPSRYTLEGETTADVPMELNFRVEPRGSSRGDDDDPVGSSPSFTHPIKAIGVRA